jgi:hypothetical protein
MSFAQCAQDIQGVATRWSRSLRVQSDADVVEARARIATDTTRLAEVVPCLSTDSVQAAPDYSKLVEMRKGVEHAMAITALDADRFELEQGLRNGTLADDEALETRASGIRGRIEATAQTESASFAKARLDSLAASFAAMHEAQSRRATEDAQRRIGETTMVQRFASDLTDSDAIVQAKIAAAWSRLSAADILMTRDKAGFYSPTPNADARGLGHDELTCDKAYAHGGDVVLTHGGGIQFMRQACVAKTLPEGTPGIAWSRGKDGRGVIFVTFDGGRYLASERDLTAWQKAPGQSLVHDALDLDDIAVLATAGQIPALLASDLKRRQDAGLACGARIIKRFEPQFEALRVADLFPTTRQNRWDALDDVYGMTLDRECQGSAKAVRQSWLKAVEHYDNLRAQTAAAFAQRFLP